KNIDRAIFYIKEASNRGADMVCLPECFNIINVQGISISTSAETVPGPLSNNLSNIAKEYRISIIATYPVRDGEKLYNQATIFNKKGEIAGFYRKVQPTASEVKSIGITPGDEFPVFDIESAKIAVMICMDIYFPEIVRIYAFKGAEIVFWPTMAHGPTQFALETQFRARALDNSMIMVQSNYACRPPYAPYAGRFRPGRAYIVDHNGDIIADTGRREGIAIAKLDLDEIRLTSGCVGIREPDHIREDLQAITRLDLYGSEYLKLAKSQKRYY
ncbi:MAG: carbon-nitrogen hydrolase family protein, partial [bacterium]|nr:carbon-nitrogen hydrolase family protein [bacterium]